MKARLRLAALILLVLLPFPLRRLVYIRFFGFSIDPTARVGYTLLLCRYVRMGAHARVGHLNLVKGLDRFELSKYSSIGNLNWITGFPISDRGHYADDPGREPSFLLGAHSALTNRHLVDCSTTVTIGSFSTFAGFRSQVLTHSIDLRIPKQKCAAVTIGNYCFVGTGVVILPGSKLPDRSVLAAGSVLVDSLIEEQTLYGGVPARAIKKLDDSLGYFTRQTGYVF